MSSPPSSAVVAGVDYPAQHTPAVAWAAQEAVLRDAPLLLVTGWIGAAHGDSHLLREGFLQDGVRRGLDALAGELGHWNPGLKVTTTADDADAHEALQRRSADARLLVVGARGTGGFPGLLVGSTALRIAATADCPVVVVPGSGSEPPDRGDGQVVVGVDGPDRADACLAFSFETAQREPARLRVVHAWHHTLTGGSDHVGPLADEARIPAEQDRVLNRLLDPWIERYPQVQLRPETVHSTPAKYLVALSQQARLVVVGRHGHPTGPLGRLGSVGQTVVQYAHCPVAVVPPP
ncbi:universal stress protein [Streptacidiphilus melanogenes]|uniref:universal stress protein n=1 Tax=Streptacidiphilus melanogenes TaxID=411235 RepID=UPI0005A8D9A7|nr:universal stress protein [Streptacidiphilus melanogenes]